MVLSVGIALAQQPRYTDGPYVFESDTKQYVSYASGDAHNLETHMLQMDPPASSFKVFVNDEVIDTFDVHIHTPAKEVDQYQEPEKLVAISDIEGNFTAFRKLLMVANVMNEKAEWIYGKGHLVLLGDFMDRGVQVTQCLWLAYELERQAALAGGKVHFVIGNHENMNLRGNDKYVSLRYTELARKMKTDYENLWGAHTVLGAWLRSKNCVVKIGNTLFLHGGISPYLLDQKLNLSTINALARKYYGYRHAREIQEAYPVFSTSKGPMWYRGYFKEPISQKQINRITSYFDVDHIAVGHTIQTKIKTYYKNKVIAIDTPHKKYLTKGKLQVLIKSEDNFYVLHQTGKKKILF
jgi:hypothetical protein